MSSKIFKSFSIAPVSEARLLLSKKEEDDSTHSIDSSELAKELVKDAEQKAAAILKQAQDEILAEKEKAETEFANWKQLEEERVKMELEEIRRQGFNQGYEEGIQEAETDYSSRMKLAQDVLEKTYVEKKEIIKESEPFVIDMCIQIASKIIRKELDTNPEVLIHMIKQSLIYSNERSSISICVSPEDFSYVQNQRNQLLECLEGQMEVKILPEHSIEKGGCVIRTSYGTIDARIDVQLKEIKQALLKTLQDELYEENTGD